MTAEKIKKALRAKPKTSASQTIYLSTGSTLLNLAFSNLAQGGFVPGLCYSFVGDSNSGKTWLAMSALAEATIDPRFKDYRLIFDNAENGSHMDVEKYFGKKAFDRIERVTPSITLEQFYDHMDDIKTPFVTVLDSMDALWTEPEAEQLHKEKTARNKGRETTGSYGTSKAKLNSARLRVLTNSLIDMGSILILISQTRDNIGFGAKFQPKTYAGGNAIKFYSRIQMWTSVKKRLKKTYRDKDHVIGTLMQVKVTKNHVTGWEGMVDVPIIRGVGIDDLGACVDYIVDMGHWKKSKTGIAASELGITLSREEFIKHVEAEELENELREIVQDVWHETQTATQTIRKPRYS